MKYTVRIECFMNDNNVYSTYKSGRILYLYTKLINGEAISKSDEAKRFGVNKRSIQRDIDELRMFFENQFIDGKSNKKLIYDRTTNSYQLIEEESPLLRNSEILAVCKILLESRSMCRDDMQSIIGKLLEICVPKREQSIVRSLVANEMLHYIEPHHKKHFIENMWELGVAIQERQMLKISYQRQDEKTVERVIKPVGIMFSEFYFYLTAFIDDIDKSKSFAVPDDVFPTIYRIDRIVSYKRLDRHFDIPYKDKFEEGEFRKRIQFMYGGKLRMIRFIFKGNNPEAVLDRLPTAIITDQNEKGYYISAEVFGNGIDMWIRSQGDLIEVL